MAGQHAHPPAVSPEAPSQAPLQLTSPPLSRRRTRNPREAEATGQPTILPSMRLQLIENPPKVRDVVIQGGNVS